MGKTGTSTTDYYESELTEIRLKGRLEDRWSTWFEGLTITLEESGETLLTGPVVDQAALYGLLRKARDLGLPLLAVNRLKRGQTDVRLGIQTDVIESNQSIGGT